MCEKWSKCAEIEKAIGGARSTKAWRVIKQLKTENDDKINKGITVDSLHAHYESSSAQDRVEFAEQIEDNDERENESNVLMEEDDVEKCLGSMKNGRSPGSQLLSFSSSIRRLFGKVIQVKLRAEIGHKIEENKIQTNSSFYNSS
ncbi:hypothetical protein HHI36_011453 [Cryptolaemus montrouzieri]|uniref:Uncharacterized protein n=1 Tax=Cryptolaemus montrouzieri TaxID=559131 RepID=A0ABD2MLR4_9CUCU